MNPEDDYQYELDLGNDLGVDNDYKYSGVVDYSGDVTVTYDTSTLTDPTMSPSAGFSIDLNDDNDNNSEFEEINERLKLIEKALGIPKKLKRNLKLEKEYPHLKEIADNYEEEVEKHITLKLLTPNLPK